MNRKKDKMESRLYFIRMHIDIIEDEPELREYLDYILKKNRISCEAYADLDSYIYSKKPKGNILLLDLMVNNQVSNGLIKKIRNAKKNIGIIMVSAIKSMDARIELLDLGADDFVSKPFDERELLARIHSLSKRYPEEKSTGRIHVQDGLVYLDKELIPFTSKELTLFLHLYKSPNTIFSKDELIASIWGGVPGYQSNVVETTIRRIRAKLPKGSKLLEVVPTQGYRIHKEEI